MRRPHTLLLIALVYGLVDRGFPQEVPDVASGGLARAAASAQEIGEIMGSVNPHLSPVARLRIGQAVVRSSHGNDLDPQLVAAIILVESGARPWARSPKGAVGLMQVMPHMARDLELGGNLTTVESNVEAGCWILADNIRRLGEDDGISAYFWGSDIRGVAYLDRVRAARAAVRRLVES